MMKKLVLALMSLAIVSTAQAVTFNVTVPDGTKACYIAGDFNGWDAVNAVRMTQAGTNSFTLNLSDVSTTQVANGFKYLSGPDWKYVEKGGSGEEVGNRTETRNDKVLSWAALYNPDIISQTVTVNGYERKMRIALPDDYDSSDETYPVVFMVGVQQRYQQAGSDNQGDDFFDPESWNAVSAAQELRQRTGKPCIMVGLYSFVAENIPFQNPDFMGSGASEAFLSDYIDKVVGYVRDNYRTDRSANATTVIGGDLGANLALYAAITRPDVFGRCIAMSPMLWINRNEMIALAAEANPATRFILTYGSRETSVIKDDVTAMAAALPQTTTLVECTGAIHNDKSWGAALPYISDAFVNPSFVPDTRIDLSSAITAAVEITPQADLMQADLSFYYTQTSTTPTIDNSVTVNATDSYTDKSGNRISVRYVVKDISKDFKSKCYWNIMDNSTNQFITSTGNVSFSSKKTAESWLRVIVKESGTVESTAASSIGFRAIAADETVLMTPAAGHHATATVKFTGDDKTFSIHFGSVNSQSDMGAVTGTLSVSDNCLEALLDYDFALNTVKITETKWGENLNDIAVVNFTAVPAVTIAGNSSRLTLQLNTDVTPRLSVSHNYGTYNAISMSNAEGNSWICDLDDLQQGIYHISLDVARGNNVKEGLAEIAIKVFDESHDSGNPYIVANAYKDIDWATVGRYKANLHTHTSQSFDTQFATNEVVDLYHGAGYSILALTDHDYNPYPWTLFDLFNPNALSRDPAELDMLAIPGNELSKDNRNSWSEATGGDFNHHNDFFTGRKGQEFASLRESYAYTQALGGMQIINHPGQYWSLDRQYTPGEKNSPEWHVENFMTYHSLVGLEVYNQGNRRPNDRILWDQILDQTMPARPVWGYSCDDTHTREQYFRNYQFILMPSLTIDDLKTAMRNGSNVFSYEYTGSGEAKAPRVNTITVDEQDRKIAIDSDADNIYWIYSTDKPSDGVPSTRKSTVIGMGPEFDYNGYSGKYVRALLKNKYGETCTQPFGFSFVASGVSTPANDVTVPAITILYNSASHTLSVFSDDDINSVAVYDVTGKYIIGSINSGNEIDIDMSAIAPGVYITTAKSANYTQSCKIIVR